MDRTVLVIGKAPEHGRVKTRLAAEVGADVALEVYRVLLSITLDAVHSSEWTVVLAIDGDVRSMPHHAYRVIPQRGDDLGSRLINAAHDAGTVGHVLIIGTDAPSLTTEDLRDAFRALDTADVVIGPATDGGYWLIGFAAIREEVLRDIPWSTQHVCAVTQERCAALGLRVALLGTKSDIDTAHDLEAWHTSFPGR